MYHFKSLNKKETAFLKGIGMLLILFHNYSHAISPWTGENEFGFSYDNTAAFVRLLSENPFDIFRLSFAFAGHYGVQLFFFVSGYGLFISYRNRDIKWPQFFKKHLKKLYPTYLLAICLYLLLYYIRYREPIDAETMQYAVLDMLFLQNFFPGAAFKLVGPWWFFSVILQFYIIFPFIIRLFNRYGIRSILFLGIGAFIVTSLFSSAAETYGYNLYHFFIGWLPVFCLGVFFSRLGDFKFSRKLIFAAFLVVILGNLSRWIWPLTMLGAALSLVVLCRSLFNRLQHRENIRNGVIWIGTNSLFIFAFHPLLRHPFVSKAMYFGNPLITILLGMGFLVLSLLIVFPVKKIDRLIQNKLNHSQPA